MAKGFKEPKQFKVIGEMRHMGGANVCPLNAPILAIDNRLGGAVCIPRESSPPEPMPLPKHIHYVPPAGGAAPPLHVSSYSPFAPKTPVSYASMPGAPKIPHFYAEKVSHVGSGAETVQTQQLVAQVLEAQVPRATQQALAAQASQTALGGKGEPYYMYGVLKYPGMSESLFEQQRIDFSDLKSPNRIQEEILEAQRIKKANEAHAAQLAKQQERDAANEAHKKQLAKEFEESRVGYATKQFELAQEIHARAVEQYKNIPHNFNYHENRVIAARQVDQAAKQVETMQALKFKAEQDASEKLWHEREHARVWAENIKMYEALANRQAKEKEEEVVRAEERIKIRSQEDKEFLAEKSARIDIAKEKLYKIELNPQKHNALEVEEYSPLIIKTLMQYSRDYDGFNKQIISDTIPIQVLHTLSLKKLTSVDSHVVDLIFDLLRDNHLPSLKTLDLSDNPKSIGKGQISKLADSFFSGNNNLETLDISCVYPPPTDLRAPFKPGGERLVGDAYAGDYPLGHKLFELYCSVSTCNQPLSITLESAVSYPLNSCSYRFDALHIPYMFFSHYMDWMGEPESFKTTSIDMVNHTRQILEKMIEIQDERNLRHGHHDFSIRHGEEVPHVIETFTWGITKCLTPKTLNKADFEWVKASLIKSPHDYHHLARIMQLTQTKLDAFVCVTEVIDDRIITHDMLNHKAEWQDAFPLGHFNNRYSIKGWKENITKELVVSGKANTKTFDSGCKHCEESQFAHFLNILSILEKNDVTAMTNLNLSNSDMDDCKPIHLRVLDVSGNHITPTGEGFFAKVLQSPLVQDIMITIKKYSTDLGQQVIKPALKEFLQDVHKLGVEISHFKTTQGSIEYLGAYLASHLSRDGVLFTTPGAKMSEHMARLCKKGGEEVINFTWGISKCATGNPVPLIENVAEGKVGELVKDGVIEAIGNKTIQKIDIFMCVTEVIDKYPVSSDILDCIGSFSALFDE